MLIVASCILVTDTWYIVSRVLHENFAYPIPIHKISEDIGYCITEYINGRVMFPNVLNSQSLQYYNKYITEYRHQYEEILKHYSSSKSKTIGYQSSDILLPTPPYFVENLLNGKIEKEESSIESPLSSEYNDDTSQKSPSMTSNHLLEATSRNSESPSPQMSPKSHEHILLRENSHHCRSSKVNSAADVPKDYSVNKPSSQQYRNLSNYAIDRICSNASPTKTVSSNGTTSPIDSIINPDSTPPTGEFNSFPDDTCPSVGSEKYGKS